MHSGARQWLTHARQLWLHGEAGVGIIGHPHFALFIFWSPWSMIKSTLYFLSFNTIKIYCLVYISVAMECPWEPSGPVPEPRWRKAKHWIDNLKWRTVPLTCARLLFLIQWLALAWQLAPGLVLCPHTVYGVFCLFIPFKVIPAVCNFIFCLYWIAWFVLGVHWSIPEPRGLATEAVSLS